MNISTVLTTSGTLVYIVKWQGRIAINWNLVSAIKEVVEVNVAA